MDWSYFETICDLSSGWTSFLSTLPKPYHVKHKSSKRLTILLHNTVTALCRSVMRFWFSFLRFHRDWRRNYEWKVFFLWYRVRDCFKLSRVHLVSTFLFAFQPTLSAKTDIVPVLRSHLIASRFSPWILGNLLFGPGNCSTLVFESF